MEEGPKQPLDGRGGVSTRRNYHLITYPCWNFQPYSRKQVPRRGQELGIEFNHGDNNLINHMILLTCEIEEKQSKLKS